MNDRELGRNLDKYLAENPAPKGGTLRQFLDKQAIRKHDKIAFQVAQFLATDPHPAVQARDAQVINEQARQLPNPDKEAEATLAEIIRNADRWPERKNEKEETPFDPSMLKDRW
jgi:hypothetical protein